MPRAKSKSKEQIVTSAMHVFWSHGFNATSMDELVKKTETSRHAIYAECGGKEALFKLTLDMYQQLVVDPAFLQVEDSNADIASIKRYFEMQISAAEQAGPPFPGCLVANTMTETGPHDQRILKAVSAHNSRLEQGYLNVLQNEAVSRQIYPSNLQELASFLAISTQGLWAYSRSLSDTKTLRVYVKNLMNMIEESLA